MLGKMKADAKALFRWRWRWRSSQTGRFVTRDYAEHHPDVTEKERAP